jgi:nucleoid DNA-binding protein
VNISLYPSNLSQDGKKRFYGRIRRRTVTLDNVIAHMVREYHTGVSPNIIEHAAGLLKTGMKDFLSQGYAVDLLNFGTLYITVRGEITPDMTKSELSKHIHLSFTPSLEMENEVRRLAVGIIQKPRNGRIIERIEDLSDPDSDGQTVTCGHAVKISGTALKLGGDEYGVYFAPVSADDALVKDRSAWTKVENVFTNKPSNLQFYVPEQLEPGKSYRIVVISSLSVSGNRIKSPVQTVSETVQAVK